MLNQLRHLEEDGDRVLVDAELAPSQAGEQSRALALTLGVQSTRLELGCLEDLRERVDAGAEGNVGEVVVAARARRGDRPEDDEVDRARVEKREEVSVQRLVDRR